MKEEPTEQRVFRAVHRFITGCYICLTPIVFRLLSRTQIWTNQSAARYNAGWRCPIMRAQLVSVAGC